MAENDGWRSFLHLLIRPERDPYQVADLGSMSLTLGGVSYSRTDFQVDSRGHMLECSTWHSAASLEGSSCVLHLHSSSGSRCEALQLLPFLLPMGVSVCSFDFTGCGKSEGEYVTLGHDEQHDVENMLEHLHASGVANVAIWGRDLGAVAAIMYLSRSQASRPLPVQALICDSAYSNLEDLCVEFADEQQMHLPGFVVKGGLKVFVSKELNRLVHFRLSDMKPVSRVRSIKNIPAIFLHGENDRVVRARHSRKLASKYGGDKELLLVPGKHSTPRPIGALQACLALIHSSLDLEGTVPAVAARASEQQAGVSRFICEIPKADVAAGSLRLIVLTVSSFGIKLLTPVQEEEIQAFPFQHLKGWKASDDALLIAGINNANEGVTRRFLTSQGQEILSALQNCMRALVEAKGGVVPPTPKVVGMQFFLCFFVFSE